MSDKTVTTISHEWKVSIWSEEKGWMWKVTWADGGVACADAATFEAAQSAIALSIREGLLRHD
jgi:hypothetical protein